MKYRQDPITGKLHEVKDSRRDSGCYIQSDISPFVSPIDGSVIRTRRELVDHEKRTGMTNDLDHLREQKHAPAKLSKHERKLAIKDAMEKTSSSGFHREVMYDE